MPAKQPILKGMTTKSIVIEIDGVEQEFSKPYCAKAVTHHAELLDALKFVLEMNEKTGSDRNMPVAIRVAKKAIACFDGSSPNSMREALIQVRDICYIEGGDHSAGLEMAVAIAKEALDAR